MISKYKLHLPRIKYSVHAKFETWVLCGCFKNLKFVASELLCSISTFLSVWMRDISNLNIAIDVPHSHWKENGDGTKQFWGDALSFDRSYAECTFVVHSAYDLMDLQLHVQTYRMHTTDLSDPSEHVIAPVHLSVPPLGPRGIVKSKRQKTR